MLKSKTFRVFVSSPFSDFITERNALNSKVFPKLSAFCKQHGTRFQVIDLRWGVPDEATHEHSTMDICLREIERCQRLSPKPNFIVLLGDRYGWRPLPPRIPFAIFDSIINALSHDPNGKNLLCDWYLLDENAVPHEYLLKPQLDSKSWAETESHLRQALLKGIEGLEEKNRPKYDTSATEQEIEKGAMCIKNATEHVFCFFRTNGCIDQKAKAYFDLDQSGKIDEAAFKRIQSLKDRLRQKLPDNCEDYRPSWQEGKLDEDYIKSLCDDVYRCLKSVISAEIKNAGDVDEREVERQAHQDFAEERCRHFLGRKNDLTAIQNYIEGQDRHPLLVYGAGGMGKSALLAASLRDMPKQKEIGGYIFYRFIGATPRSGTVDNLITGLGNEICSAYGDTFNGFDGYEQLKTEFLRVLGLATQTKPLTLYLDAIDQLVKAGASRAHIDWIPAELPPYVKIVVSALEDSNSWNDLLAVNPSIIPLPLKKLKKEDGLKLLRLWMKNVERCLTPDQTKVIRSKFAKTGNPLHLKLMFEEARHWRSYDKQEETVVFESIEKTIIGLFDRLSKPANHGEMLVKYVVSYLLASRNGLSEDELLDLLSRDERIIQWVKGNAWHDLPDDRLPVALWARLYGALEPYIIFRESDDTSLFGFFHRIFYDVLQDKYLSDAGWKKNIHSRIGEYFNDQPLWLNQRSHIPNKRKSSELPYQLHAAERWNDLVNILCNLPFVEVKIASGMTHDLLGDYSNAIAALPEVKKEIEKGRESEKQMINNPIWLDRIKAFSHFVGSESHALTKYYDRPGFVIQHAYNYTSTGSVAKATEKEIKTVTVPMLLRARHNRLEYNPHPALLRTLQHTDVVHSVSVALDGKLAVSGTHDRMIMVWDLESGKCVRTFKGHTESVYVVSLMPDGKQVVSASKDGTVKKWNMELNATHLHKGSTARVRLDAKGKSIVGVGSEKTMRLWEFDRGQYFRSIRHPFRVPDVSVTPDGQRAVTANDDEKVGVWDIELKACLYTLEGHADRVSCVSVTPDGTRAVSGSLDKTLRVWDLESRKCLHTLEGHTLEVTDVSITPDAKRVVSASKDGTVRVWDTSGECVKRPGHTGLVYDVSVTQDGKMGVSSGDDGTVRVWDVESGECISPFKEHQSGATRGASVTPDGRRVVSASYDGKVLVWDIESRKCLHTLEGHASKVNDVSITPDGKRLVSAGEDKQVRVWDIESDEPRRILNGHSEAVNNVRVTPDGKRVVSLGDYGEVGIWDIESGECIHPLKKNTGWVKDGCITPDGKLAVVASRDGKMIVWDIESGEYLHTLEGHSKQIDRVTITPNGKHAVSASYDRRIIVWDIESGEPCHSLQEHNDAVNSVRVTPDGKRIVSAGYDNAIMVWDIESGERLALYHDTAGIRSVSKSRPDGSFLYGPSSGSPVLLTPMNLASETPLITAVRLWLSSTNQWDENVTSTCTYCGIRFSTPRPILSTIEGIIKNAGLTPEQSPCIKLDVSVWNEPGLLSECPECGSALRYNPFVVDNRGVIETDRNQGA